MTKRWGAFGRTAPWLITTALALVAFLALPAVRAKQSEGSSADPRKPAAQEWTLVGGDWGDTRHSSLSQINTTNIKDLGAAWVSKKFEDGGTSRVTPVVKDGLMFLTAGNRIFALNAETGETVWNYKSSAPMREYTLGTAHDVGVPNFQGVGLGEGLVFVALMNGDVVALQEKTGEVAWVHDLKVGPTIGKEQSSSAPIYADGMVFCSLATGERYIGQAIALDAKTGRELWRFKSIPAPGEPGHETWPAESNSWKMGGGNIWLPPAVDPDLGLVYYGAGNADPIVGGEVRPGNNLYTSCVVALDMKSGKVRWYYQLVHHDLWEGDVATPVVLYDAHVDGRDRKAIAAIRPDGYLFQLDRATGKPLLPVEERHVPQNALDKTAPTQPFPVGGQSILADCDEWKSKVPAGFVVGCRFTPPAIDAANVLTPSFGVRVEPMSFSPQTGYFYAQGRESIGHIRRSDDPQYWGPLVGRRPDMNKGAATVLAAIDSRTGKLAWKKRMPAMGGFGTGGSLSTAGRLLFHRNGDGNFDAYDAKTGDVLWQFQTGNPGGDSTPSTYEIGGQQYVAVTEGTVVWAFRLGGTLKPLAAPKLPANSDEGITGPIQDTDRIETSSLYENDPYSAGARYFMDDYSFNPYRSRVKAGTPVLFMNNGREVHTVVAQDGSWTTGPIEPNETVPLTFSKPGTYTYICKQHPFSYGQIIVVENSANTGSVSAPGSSAAGFAGQAQRGKIAYEQNCSGCHQRDLSGNGEAAPALAGSDFLVRWQARTAADLFDKTRTTMPPGAAGSLTDQQYFDILAYLLQANEISSGGNQELRAEGLKTLNLAK